jgi:iron complex outermembrane receptor protein
MDQLNHSPCRPAHLRCEFVLASCISLLTPHAFATTPPIAEITITASPFKLEVPAEQVPQTVSVISRESIDQRSVQSVEEALTQVASVQSGMGGRVGYDEFSIRGFSQSYYQFKNGLRLDPGYLQQEDMAGLERIEVIKGPASVEYGQIAPGGVVNLVSKQPQRQPIREFGWSTGSWGSQRVTADLGDSWHPDSDWMYRIPIAISETQDVQHFVYSRRQYIAPTFAYRPNGVTQLTLYSLWQHDDFRRSVSVPFAIVKSVDRSTYLGIPSLPTFSRPQTQLGYSFSHEFDNGWRIKQQFRQTRYSFTGSSFFPQYEASLPNEVAPGGGSFARQIRVLSFDQQVSRSFQQGLFTHHGVLGYDHTNYRADKWSGRINATLLNYRHPIYPELSTPALASQGNDTIAQHGLYGL